MFKLAREYGSYDFNRYALEIGSGGNVLTLSLSRGCFFYYLYVRILGRSKGWAIKQAPIEPQHWLRADDLTSASGRTEQYYRSLQKPKFIFEI